MSTFAAQPFRRLAGAQLAVFVAVAALALPAAGRTATGEGRGEAGISMAGGSAEGFYQEVAEGVAARVTGVRAVATAGSVENLELLARGRVRFALAQQDVVSELFRRAKATGRDAGVRVVGRVFFDDLHILVRSPLHVERASEFRWLRVWPGEEGSGTRHTAVDFLESVGISRSVLERSAVDPSTLTSPLSELFAEGRLDAAMIVTMPGSDRPCRVMASGRATLFPLDYATIRTLTAEAEDSPFQGQVTTANIPADTYPNQPRAVPTVAVPVLLLSRVGESSELAGRLLEAARATWRALVGTPGRAGCRRLEEAPSGARLGAANLEMLPGLEEREPWWVRWRLAGLLALGALAVAAGGFWLRRSGLLSEALLLYRQEKLGRRLLWGLTLGVVVITLLTYLLEHRINENFSTPWESAWSITIYLFSGLEDRTPYTPAGRVVAALGLILGPLFFAFLTGWLARVFIHWEKRMPQNLTGHFLILNWSERAVGIVRELHHPILRKKDCVSVIVVLTDDEKLDLRQIRARGTGEDELFEDFFLSLGDPTAERALRNANAQDARTVVVLADDRLGPHADERAIRSVFMLRRIALAEERKLHVVVELVDDANVPVLEEIAREFPGLVEWVAGIEVRTRLLAQAAQSQGVVGFYSDLLRVSQDTNEVYLLAAPRSAVGQTFRAYASRLLAAEPLRPGPNGETNPVIPVAVGREVDGRQVIFSNPRPGSPGWTLQEGDQLVVVAYQPPGPDDLPA